MRIRLVAIVAALAATVAVVVAWSRLGEDPPGAAVSSANASHLVIDAPGWRARASTDRSAAATEGDPLLTTVYRSVDARQIDRFALFVDAPTAAFAVRVVGGAEHVSVGPLDIELSKWTRDGWVASWRDGVRVYEWRLHRVEHDDVVASLKSMQRNSEGRWEITAPPPGLRFGESVVASRHASDGNSFGFGSDATMDAVELTGKGSYAELVLFRRPAAFEQVLADRLADATAARRVQVRGRVGVLALSAPGTHVVWQEGDGTAAALAVTTTDRAVVDELIARVRAVDDETWSRMVAKGS